MTPHQGQALAKFLHELRPDWDVHGIVSHLGYARGRASAGDLAIAAIRAALKASNRTPAVINLDGEHWRTPELSSLPSVRPPSSGELCDVCGLPEAQCKRRWSWDHAFVPVGQLAVDTTTGELLEADYPARAAEARALIARPDQPTPIPEPALTATEGAAPA